MKTVVIILILTLGGAAFGESPRTGYARAAEYFRADAKAYPTVRLVRSKSAKSKSSKKNVAKKKTDAKKQAKTIVRHDSPKKRAPAAASKKPVAVKKPKRGVREIAVSFWSKITGSSSQVQ